MTLTLEFDGSDLGTVSSLKVSQSGMAETWIVELDVEGATQTALANALAAIHDASGTTGTVKLLHGSSDVRTLETTDCRKGPTLDDVVEKDSGPGEAHNRRHVTLTVKATLQDASTAVQTHDFIVKTVIEAGQAAKLITDGHAVLRAGEDPGAHEPTLLPTLTGGYRRVQQQTTRDASEPSLSYIVEDEQVFTPLPGGVEDGHYVASESVDADGRASRVVTGFFVGAGAVARALELRPPDGRTIASRVSQNPFTRRVDFEFRETVEDANAAASTESLTFVTTRRIVDHPLLNTALPAYRQEVGAPQTEVIQEGSAVGHDRHTSPPTPRFPADLIQRQVKYSLPHPGLPADRRWVTTWRYVMRGRAALPETAPVNA